jgi:hypothetical protein
MSETGVNFDVEWLVLEAFKISYNPIDIFTEN